MKKKSVSDGISRNALASGSRLSRMSEPGASALRLIEFFGPKGRDSIAQGAALGGDRARKGQPQRGVTPAKSPSSYAPLGLTNVRRSVTQGCALGYRVSPRWGKRTKHNAPIVGLINAPVVGLCEVQP